MHAEILTRLIRGESLDGLGLRVTDGRLDISGLAVPDPTAGKTIMRTGTADVMQLMGVVKVRNVRWQSLNLQRSGLSHMKFFDCLIDNCVFDNSICQNWGLWGTTVTNCSFRSADLRQSGLGGVKEGKRNVYAEVDFSSADLRQTGCKAAEFVGCKFEDTRLDRVDFQTSTFKNCQFAGELREVIFCRRGFKGEAFPANEMENVSFARAKLRWVEFQDLDMRNVILPRDDDHIIVDQYPRMLERLVAAFEGRADSTSKRLAAVFGTILKHTGAAQRRGVVNKNDLLEIGGEEALRRVLDVLASEESGT
jgi:uncharacterized protein YjbI with pentapeptide repeats